MSQPSQQQEPPGTTDAMRPAPDHGETSYRGSDKLVGKAAIVTGGDSGIGRAVAIAFAREGADVVISYLSEHEDAQETARWVEEAGRRAVLVAGDVSEAEQCRAVVDACVREFGKVDVLVNNAAYQMSHDTLEEISDEEWLFTVNTNLSAFFYLSKAACPTWDGVVDHRQQLGELRQPQADAHPLLGDQGRDREHVRLDGAAAR